MPKVTNHPILVEVHDADNNAQWGVSFNGPNPEPVDYFPCPSQDEATRLIGLMEGSKQPVGRAPVGMYGETPRVQVGKYSISRQDEKSVYIEFDEGEGGSFSDESFEPIIKNFFNENF